MALILTPHHLIHDACVALDNLHDLRTDVLLHIVGDGDAVVAVLVHRDGSIDSLQE